MPRPGANLLSVRQFRASMVNAYRDQLTMTWGENLPPATNVAQVSSRDAWVPYSQCLTKIAVLCMTPAGRCELGVAVRGDWELAADETILRRQAGDPALTNERLGMLFDAHETAKGVVGTSRNPSAPVRRRLAQTFRRLAVVERSRPGLLALDPLPEPPSQLARPLVDISTGWLGKQVRYNAPEFSAVELRAVTGIFGLLGTDQISLADLVQELDHPPGIVRGLAAVALARLHSPEPPAM